MKSKFESLYNLKMKYLIPLYFVLFLSVITIINVNSKKKATKEWKPMKPLLNSTFVTKLGRKGVNYYNNQHKNETILIFVNVTNGLRSGKKSKENKLLKLIIMVTRSTSSNRNRKQYCQKLRVIFNDTNSGRIPIRSKLFNKTLEGECIIPKKLNNLSQNKKD
ncbi:Hypothetical protein SRAE_2000499200 [Strongyloides ratti]|uniref:Uncharacterized protein n=1 Tax=Strongyloides ratti TaxID=34506 RepID=A0A090LQA1_STRRB|nr:Hypothetical protein SRAE_2000499200 [Strongyloides ratti]CEF70359.2 Hypothetical protein SRAE_2000499200 [Strongyloides ratti]